MHVPTVVRTLLAGACLGALALPALAAPAAPPVTKPTPHPSAGAASAPVELLEEAEGMTINWTTGRITITGIGVPGDRGTMVYRKALSSRSATADAYRRFAGALDLVRVDANTRIKDLAVADDALRTRLSDFVKSARVLETNYWPDGSAEVVLGADLQGHASLAALIAGGAEPAPAPSAAAPAKEVVTEPVAVRATYSSLIIEAKGLGAQPAMLPSVRDHEGKPVELIVDGKRRPVKYLRDGALLDPAAGLNPLKVKATRTQGVLRADLVLSPADSQALKAALLDKKVGPDAPIIVVL